MLTHILRDVATATWALRWPIAAVFVLAGFAVTYAGHLEKDQAVLDELDDALDKVAALQRAVAVVAIQSATQDTPAAWINDGSNR